MKHDPIEGLLRSRTKLVEQRRAMVTRDCATERPDGFAERIVSIQNAIEATDRAIRDEQAILAHMSEQTPEQPAEQTAA